MKPLILLLALGMAVHSSAAKEFANLNFDEGAIPPEPISELQPVERVLPAWTAKLGDHVLTEVGWNVESFGNGVVSVHIWPSRPNVFEGRYGMVLQGGPEFPASSPSVPASIGQVGLIPATANSLLFRADIGSPTEVRLDGISVPYLFLEEIRRDIPGGSPLVTSLYGVDLRPFAGREVELSFLNYPKPDGVGFLAFDTLTFSTTIVPEPSTWALFGAGIGTLFWALRGRK